MTPLAALELLGQLRTFGLPALHVGEGVILTHAQDGTTYTVHQSFDRFTVRQQTHTFETPSLPNLDGKTASFPVATVPAHWSAESIAAAIVCVVMLGASPVAEGVAA